MALFSITSEGCCPVDAKQYEFKISNSNIKISTTELQISNQLITEQNWLGNF